MTFSVMLWMPSCGGMINGETVPRPVRPGEPVFAGTVNLGAPLCLEATAVGPGTLLAEIVRLMELAEERRARFVVLADRVARHHAPVVHILALLTFLGWTLLMGAAWQLALLCAVAVLIISCPCALGLAVDISQNAADAIFQGEWLQPIVDALDTARRSNRLTRQNLGLALGYNVLAVPVAVMGFVTPLVAALFMSPSSLLVVGNALRLARRRAWTSSSI